jgi:HlyD family secretion protein
MKHGWRASIAGLGLALVGCSGDAGGALLGTLERDRIELIAEAQETIVEVAVREGDAVKAGELVLRLDPSDVETRVAQARANALEAERLYAQYVAGARIEDVNEARARVASAAARSKIESVEFDRTQKVVTQGLSPVSALDRQRALRDSAIADERAARERLAQLVHGTRTEVVEQAGAALDAARAQVTGLELSLDRHAVKSPRAGIVDALPYKLGERPPKGAPVVVLLAGGQPYARVFIPEPRRTAVRAGTPATVRIDGTDRAWKAEIRHVSSEAAFTPYYSLNTRDRSRLAYLAEVVLTEPDAVDLPTGMPVEVTLADDRAGS